MKKMFAVAAIVLSTMVVFSCKNANKDAEEAADAAVEEAVEAADAAVEAAADAFDAAAAEIASRADLETIAPIDASDLAEKAVSYAAVEVKPSFNGGDATDFQKWIQENLTYPQAAIDNQEQGKVVASFIVDKDGKVTDAKILKGVSDALDAEALRVLNEAPQWTAGTQNGEPVNVAYVLPVIFALK